MNKMFNIRFTIKQMTCSYNAPITCTSVFLWVFYPFVQLHCSLPAGGCIYRYADITCPSHVLMLLVFRSFNPFVELLHSSMPAVQMWALWGMLHVCSRSGKYHSVVTNITSIYNFGWHQHKLTLCLKS